MTDPKQPPTDADRQFGILDIDVPESFFEPMPDDELARWEGSDGPTAQA
jgi:hypothetical protein